MFLLSVAAVVLTGSLLGSAGAFAVETLRVRRERRAAETDYSNLFGPNFSNHNIQPVRVTYRTSEVRKSRLVLQDFSQPEALAA